METLPPGFWALAAIQADYQCINAVSAARATLGLDAEIVELKTPLKRIAQMKDGVATGEVLNWKELVEQVRDLEFDALGLATPITIDPQTLADYFQHGGVNPVGGVEAVASKLIADALDKPVAHGPVDYALKGFTQVVDPRMAVEIITENFRSLSAQGTPPVAAHQLRTWPECAGCGLHGLALRVFRHSASSVSRTSLVRRVGGMHGDAESVALDQQAFDPIALSLVRAPFVDRHHPRLTMPRIGIGPRWMCTMTYNRGDVVLVLFPDSNLRTAKRRPALVVQKKGLHLQKVKEWDCTRIRLS